MTDKMFDQFVRDKLSNHESQVPAGLWEKIAEKDKHRKPFVLPKMFWIALVWIMAGLGGGYFVYQKVNSNNDKQQAVNTTPAGSKNDGNEKNDLNDGLTNQNNTNSRTADENDSNDGNDNNDNVKLATGDSDDGVVKNGRDDNQVADDGATKNSSTNSNNIAARKNRKTTAGKDKTDNNVLINDKDNAAVLKNGIRSPRIKSTSTANKTATSVLNNDVLNSTVDGTEKAYTPFIAGSAFSLKNLSALENKNRKLSDIRLSNVDCPPNGSLSRNDLYIEVYGSPDYTFKSVKATGAATSFINKKDSTETQTGGFTAGFRLSKAFSNNMMLKAGLQYSQLNERFDLRTENERRQITVITTRTVIRGPGDTLIISDTSVQDIVGYRVKRTHNTYRNIEVPILLGYEFGGDKWRYGINAGVIVNLRTQYTGEALDTSFMPAALNSKSVGMKKNSVGLGLYAGFSIIKPIGNKIDVFAEPYFRYNLSQMESSAGYKQRFSAAGLNIGIRYRLKGRGTGNADK